jgi:hypothetical protein
MVNIDTKQIKLQIWDTAGQVCERRNTLLPSRQSLALRAGGVSPFTHTLTQRPCVVGWGGVG